MLIDAHAHLDHYDSGNERRAALNEIDRERILTIAVAMNPASYDATKRLARGYKTIVPCFGIHPWEAPKHSRHLDSLLPQIAETPLIGEIGLDKKFVKDIDLYPAQRRVFDFFLAAAKQHNKIVNIHSSGAEADVLAALESHGIERAIVHWYNGPMDVFEKLVARGCYFTFGVELKSSPAIQMLARACPQERLLTETDNPGGAKWLFGQPGQPRIIGSVVASLAEVRGTSPAEMVEIVRQNFLRLISGPTGDDAGLATVRDVLNPPA